MTVQHRFTATRCLLPVMIAVFSACGSARGAGDGLQPSERPRTHVTIENGYLGPVNVYYLRGGTRFRLGTVHSMATETFPLPAHVTTAGTVRLLADPIGENETFVTEPIMVASAQRVVFQIGSRLTLSNYFVRNW